jgi:hypothetical protein
MAIERPGEAAEGAGAAAVGGLQGDVAQRARAALAGVGEVPPAGSGERTSSEPGPCREYPGAEQARNSAVTEAASESGLSDPEQVAALRDAYDVVYEYSGALIVKTAADMLPDLRADAEQDPSSRVVFVGRDGRSLAVAVNALDPGFFREHCTEVVLSRALAETAVQDLEQRQGATFPQLADFRGAAGKVDPADTLGAYRQLTDYLGRHGVPVGEPGSHVTLVDTSYKGTVQELLAAVYPDTEFFGRYAFFAGSPADPHPGTKKGYAVHLEGDAANGGRPVPEMPGDPRLTYSHQEALAAVEDTLHGPGSSPRRISGGLPEQQLARDDPTPLEGFNPRVVSPRFADPVVRDAVLRIGHRAIEDRAANLAAEGGTARLRLDQAADRFRDEIRAWVAGRGVDPRLGEYLNSFVRRTDKRAAARLGAAVSSAGLDERQADEAWRAFGQCRTLAAKDAYVAQFMRDNRRGAAGDG